MSSFEEQAEKAGMNYLNNTIATLTELRTEICNEGYQTAGDVMGAINNRIDSLIELKGEQ